MFQRYWVLCNHEIVVIVGEDGDQSFAAGRRILPLIPSAAVECLDVFVLALFVDFSYEVVAACDEVCL